MSYWQFDYSNNSLSFWYCLQCSIDSKEKSVRLWEKGSFVQLMREKLDSTLLVPGIMLAMAPQNLCRSWNSPPSGAQHCSNVWTTEPACEFWFSWWNSLRSLNAKRSLRNWSSIFSTLRSENICFSRILCCSKQQMKSLESREHKSRGSTGGNCCVELFWLSRSAQTLEIPTTICSEKLAMVDTCS